MTPELKTKLIAEFRKMTNRNPKPDEEINIENDYLLVQRVLVSEVETLRADVEKLKKP